MEVARVYSSDLCHVHAVQTGEGYTPVEGFAAATNLETGIL